MLAEGTRIHVQKADQANLKLDPADELYDLLRDNGILAGWTEPSCRPSDSNYFGVAAEDGERALECLETHGYVCELDDAARDLINPFVDADPDTKPTQIVNRLLSHDALKAATRPPFTD